MRTTRIVSKASVVGYIWQPGIGLCAQDYPISVYDVENIRDEAGNITREGVATWLDTHAGDFSSIVDFSVTIGDGEFDSDWADEENAGVYQDAMYGAMFGDEE